MTADNNDGHILYELGDFSFISDQPAWCGISDELEIMCKSAFTLYTKYGMEDFFKKFPPPSQHQYIWWLPHQKGFEEWKKIEKILRDELFESNHFLCSDFDLITRMLSQLANQGWQDVVKDFGNILNIIIKNYQDYEIY